MKKCCGKTSGLLKVAILVFLVTLVLYLIGFSSPFWSRRTGSNEGLFEVCQAGTCVPSAQSVVLSSESWYVATQALAILSLFMVITALVLLMIMLFAVELANSIPLLISAIAFIGFAVLFILIALVVYGVRGSVFIEGIFLTPFEVGFAFILMAVALFGFLAVAIILIIDLDRKLKCKDSDAEEGCDEGCDDDNCTPAPPPAPLPCDDNGCGGSSYHREEVLTEEHHVRRSEHPVISNEPEDTYHSSKDEHPVNSNEPRNNDLPRETRSANYTVSDKVPSEDHSAVTHNVPVTRNANPNSSNEVSNADHSAVTNNVPADRNANPNSSDEVRRQ